MAASMRGCRWPWTLHHRLLDRVEIAAAVDIEDVAAFAALQDQRLILGHLREGMPDERAVPVAELIVMRCAVMLDPHSHATTTGVPIETPSRAAALSPTIASSRRPEDPIRATSIPGACSP